MKKFIIIFGAVILLGLIAGGIYYFFGKSLQSEQNLLESQNTHKPCLGDDEIASFNIIGKRTTATSADIIITDKITSKEKFRFQVDNLFPNIGWPYEFRKCGVYIIKEFNWDEKHSKPLPGYKEELWRYTYDGKGKFFFNTY